MNELLVQRDVVAELDRVLGAGTFTIGVEVHHGVVKLSGNVKDEGRRQLAETTARQTIGTTIVVNDIDLPRQATRTIQ